MSFPGYPFAFFPQQPHEPLLADLLRRMADKGAALTDDFPAFPFSFVRALEYESIKTFKEWNAKNPAVNAALRAIFLGGIVNKHEVRIKELPEDVRSLLFRTLVHAQHLLSRAWVGLDPTDRGLVMNAGYYADIGREQWLCAVSGAAGVAVLAYYFHTHGQRVFFPELELDMKHGIDLLLHPNGIHPGAAIQIKSRKEQPTLVYEVMHRTPLHPLAFRMANTSRLIWDETEYLNQRERLRLVPVSVQINRYMLDLFKFEGHAFLREHSGNLISQLAPRPRSYAKCA